MKCTSQYLKMLVEIFTRLEKQVVLFKHFGDFLHVKESFQKVWSSINMFTEMVRFKYFLKLPRALQMTTASRATRMSFTIATN